MQKVLETHCPTLHCIPTSLISLLLAGSRDRGRKKPGIPVKHITDCSHLCLFILLQRAQFFLLQGLPAHWGLPFQLRLFVFPSGFHSLAFDVRNANEHLPCPVLLLNLAYLRTSLNLRIYLNPWFPKLNQQYPHWTLSKVKRQRAWGDVYVFRFYSNLQLRFCKWWICHSESPYSTLE